ncbi:aminotransferase class V-fold PLP-dependent enzyme [Treponema saccharophilum]|uniref:Probable cysteine desulfurase n=1 Tax=Treponema saccharophilum DSM 2985 TaxID=907348 RepID=H7EHD2_9SPIR|nr:SufS family cysteine desulfurase [Treponema saccharophilum]EIC03052.1 cysteine desulfurase [Treponema saccharophilum DSM 2985]BDC96410.1 cysteine desulfurase [Treponema saccharophilum]
MNKYRKDFPLFKAIDEHNSTENNGLVYMDTAATAQRPYIVLNAMTHFYSTQNANPLRGLYSLSERATKAYEDARDVVARFVGATDSREIVFTRNTSESLNLVANTWGMENVKEGDEIVISIMEHHSNILPWQFVCEKKNATLKFMYVDKETGEIPESEFEKITPKTKIVSITHVSNVLGTTNPVRKIADIAHKNGAIVVVDGAQSSPHMKIDVHELGADFFCMSGHKLCGPMGIGALWGRYELLDAMPPFLRGGEMIEYVTETGATWADVPHKFEAGTVSAGDAVGMAAAIRYIQSIGLDTIEENDANLAEMLAEGIKKIPHVNIIGGKDGRKRCGIITFTVDGVHPHDIATLLSDENIAIRAGHHCAQPLGAYLGETATARASLYFYNTEQEVEYLLKKLAQIRKWSGFKD